MNEGIWYAVGTFWECDTFGMLIFNNNVITGILLGGFGWEMLKWVKIYRRRHLVVDGVFKMAATCRVITSQIERFLNIFEHFSG